MLENFIYTERKSLFKKELEAGNVLDEAIVFIEDTKEIWNHGTYFSFQNLETIPEVTESNSGFMTPADLDKLNNSLNIYYATCNNTGQYKYIYPSNWRFSPGALLIVTFSADNTSTTPVFNFPNWSKSVSIKCNGQSITSSTLQYAGKKNCTILYVYDGTNFHYIAGVDSSFTTMTQSEANSGANTVGQLISAKVLNDTITSKISNKQNTISDLDTIRTNASKGATAVQPDDISDMETKTHASETYALKESIPTKVSQLSNDVPYFIDDFDDGVYIMDASTKLCQIDNWTEDKGYIGIAKVISDKIYVIDPNAYQSQFSTVRNNLPSEVFGTDYGYYNTNYIIRMVPNWNSELTLINEIIQKDSLFDKQWYLPSITELGLFYRDENFDKALEKLKLSKVAPCWSSEIYSGYPTYEVYTVRGFIDYSAIAMERFDPDEIKYAYAMWSAPYKKSIKTQVNNLEQIVNSYNYEDGVYVVNQHEQLLPVEKGTSDCIAVAVIQGPHKFYIEKNNNFYDVSLQDSGMQSDIGYSFADECQSDSVMISDRLYDSYYGCVLPDYTKWTDGALSDFNGYENTKKGTLELLNNFNNSPEQQYNDWYIPSLGQLGIIYTLRNEINIALNNIGGALLDLSKGYGSNTKGNENYYYLLYFIDGTTNWCDSTSLDDTNYFPNTATIRFIRNFELPKTIKELETKIDKYHEWSILDVSTFSINGTSYEFEEGMTWRDWIYSDYYQEAVLTLNIGSTETIQQQLENVSGNVTLYNTAGLQYSPSINSDDLIISNQAYITQMMKDQQL